jgi:hypothetical protein
MLFQVVQSIEAVGMPRAASLPPTAAAPVN